MVTASKTSLHIVILSPLARRTRRRALLFARQCTTTFTSHHRRAFEKSARLGLSHRRLEALLPWVPRRCRSGDRGRSGNAVPRNSSPPQNVLCTEQACFVCVASFVVVALSSCKLSAVSGQHPQCRLGRTGEGAASGATMTSTMAASVFAGVGCGPRNGIVECWGF